MDIRAERAARRDQQSRRWGRASDNSVISAIRESEAAAMFPRALLQFSPPLGLGGQTAAVLPARAPVLPLLARAIRLLYNSTLLANTTITSHHNTRTVLASLLSFRQSQRPPQLVNENMYCTTNPPQRPVLCQLQLPNLLEGSLIAKSETILAYKVLQQHYNNPKPTPKRKLPATLHSIIYSLIYL